MRLLTGISACLTVACLLAGCVTQPTRATSPAPPTAPIAVIGSHHVLRIGLEFLPPDERLPASDEVEVERRLAMTAPVQASERAVRTVQLRNMESTSTPRLTQIDFESIDDPIARETMHFCSDLINTDRQRVQREVGIPFFHFRDCEMDLSPLLTSERRQREEHEQWSQQHGIKLLQRPLRLMAKRMPLARDLDLAFEEFRSHHVPLSEPYRQAHGDRRKLGRLSLRVRANDLTDPIEFVYMHHSGVRVGSSQNIGKLALDFELTETIRFTLRARSDYRNGDSGLRADLIYQPSANMSVHLAAGDDMDFLATSSLYSLFETPMDGSPGVVLFAVHTF